MLLGLVLGLAANAAGLATPMVTKWVLDTLGAGESMARPIGALLALVVVGAAVSLWQWRLLGTLAEHIVLDARASIVRHYTRLALVRSRSAAPVVPRWVTGGRVIAVVAVRGGDAVRTGRVRGPA